MPSYRSELGGLVAGLTVPGTLFRSGAMNIRSIRFICDNKSAVTAARRPTSEIIFHNTRCDWDLIATIQDLIVRWCKGIALSFHWVKGHAYLIDRPLTRYERLIIEADIQSDVIRAQTRGPIAAHPNCPHWDIEAASLFIQGSKVTSDMKNKITSQMHDDNMRSFLMKKESWSSQTFDAIDWHSSERALRRLSKNRQMNVVKLCHNIGTPVQDMSDFMEENAHAVSTRKPKRIGDKSSSVRHLMRATTKTPHGKRSRRPCKCGDSRHTFGQLLKRDYINYPLI
jgi:hypothetical protein